MKFLPLILKNIKRNLRRTFLTIGGLLVSLFVFCSLLAIINGVKTLFINSANNYIIIVSEKNRGTPMHSRVPENYKNHIFSIKHVVDVTPEIRYLNSYRDGEDKIRISGIDPENFREFKDIEIKEKYYDKFKENRSSAIIGKELAKKYKWKIGDHIKLNDNLSFTVSGIFSLPFTMYDSMIVLHKDYIQKILDRDGIITYFAVKVDDTKNVPNVISAIDNMFNNYPTQTMSNSEKDYWMFVMDEMGRMMRMISVIAILAIIVTIVGTANCISMSTLERIKEIGVFKSLGFVRRQILFIILSESVIVTLIGGILGCIMSAIALFSNPTMGKGIFAPPLIINHSIIIKGLIISGLIGLLGGFFPAYNASKLNIIDALRKVG